MNNLTKYFYIITFSLFLSICGPNLFSDGMFMDGLLYATISKNMANGIGTFWYPHLTDTLFPVFHEHPPLAFKLQSFFFYVFGESIYVERFYSLMSFIIVGLLMLLIWKKITGELTSGWIPLLLWTAIPRVTWACANNMLENTMSIFICGSAFFYVVSTEKQRYLLLLLSGVSLSLGLLTKGFVSLFIWSFPFWLWLCLKKISFKRMCIDLILMIGFTILPFIILFSFSTEAFDSLQKYFFQQVVGSISNVATVKTRFYIISRLLNDLLINIGVFFVIIKISRIKKFPNDTFFQNKKLSFVFFLLGLSGVVPIMCSMKQSGFYIIATFPFFAIAFASLVKPYVINMLSNINFKSNGIKIIKIISYCMLATSIIISICQINRIGRQNEKIEMVYDFIKLIPVGETISIHPDLWTDWSLHGYFARYANISLDLRNEHTYYLIKKNSIPENKKIKYQIVKLLNGYTLLKISPKNRFM